MNDELGIDLSVDPNDVGMPQEKPTTAECPDCGKMVRLKGDGTMFKHECGPVVDIKLEESVVDPKADWVEIIIEEVEGRANYEVVGVNGKIYQIPRSIPTKVPPSVIGVLKTAIASRSVPTPNHLTGHDELVKQNYNAIPWRLV